jgi:hypothetical protein
MDWYDRERINAGFMPRARPPGCRAILGTIVFVIIAIVVILVIAVLVGWVHLTHVKT